MSVEVATTGLRLTLVSLVSLVSLVAVALGAAAAVLPDLAVVLLLAPLTLVAGTLSPQWLVSLSLPLLTWPLLWFPPGQDTRLGVVVVAALIATRLALSPNEGGLLVSFTGWRVLALASVATASWIWSAAPADSLGSGLALLAIGVLLTGWTPHAALEARRILLRGGAGFLVLNMAACLLPVGLLAGRARGLFANPNSLAVAIVLLLPLLWTSRRYRPLALLALALLVASGSRAGVLAACAEAVVGLVLWRGRRSIGSRIVATGLLLGLAVVALWVLGAGVTDESSVGTASYVLRSGDSRTAIWLQALQAWQTRPWLGFGAGAYSQDTASSYVKLLTDLGLIGVGAALPLFVLQFRHFWRGSPQQAALIAGALVNAAFESWLFAGGSAFFLLYWMQMGEDHDPAHH